MESSPSSSPADRTPPNETGAIDVQFEAQQEFDRLFARWRETGDPELREQLIFMHINLVRFLVRRFAERGEARPHQALGRLDRRTARRPGHRHLRTSAPPPRRHRKPRILVAAGRRAHPFGPPVPTVEG